MMGFKKKKKSLNLSNESHIESRVECYPMGFWLTCLQNTHIVLAVVDNLFYISGDLLGIVLTFFLCFSDNIIHLV